MGLIANPYPFGAITRRLLQSKNGLERQHLLLGFHAEYNYPVLVPRPLLREHMLVVGPSGSGKTFRVLAPLEAGLIRAGDGAVIIIDLKGERSHFESVRLEAERSGRTFKHFTNVLGLSSYLFNPFQQINSKRVSFSQVVETIMEALRLNYGDGYGTRFFSTQGRLWVLRTLKRWPSLGSFAELYSKATPEFFKNEQEMDRCRELITVVQQVADVLAMNWKPGPGDSDRPLKDAIFMPDVIEKKQVCYFSLPTIGETSTVREIANLLLYAAVGAARNYHAAGGKNQTYLVIDEFQQMASEGFKVVHRQSRSFGFSLILACQSETDLMTRQASRLLDTVRTNTQVKVYLSGNDVNTIRMLGSGSLDDAGAVRFYSGHPDYAICLIGRDAGFAVYGGEWFGIRTGFHIPHEEFLRRESAPWPVPSESTIVAERIEDGPLSFTQGPSEIRLVNGVPEEKEPALSLKVPPDSKWAKKLMDVFNRRFPERRNGDAV